MAYVVHPRTVVVMMKHLISLLSLSAITILGACGGSESGPTFSGESLDHSVTIAEGDSSTSFTLTVADDNGLYIDVSDGARVDVDETDGVEYGSSEYDDGEVFLYTTEGGTAQLTIARTGDDLSEMAVDVSIRDCGNMVDGEGELGECT